MFSCTSNEFDVLVREKLKFFTSLGCPVNGMRHVQLLILFNSPHERVETDGDLKKFFPRHVYTNLTLFSTQHDGIPCLRTKPVVTIVITFPFDIRLLHTNAFSRTFVFSCNLYFNLKKTPPNSTKTKFNNYLQSSLSYLVPC